jgi:MoxR-like ATPase
MSIAELSASVRSEIQKVIQGQEQVIDQTLVCFLSGGHALLEGVPGLAKTLLAKCLATAVGGEFKRVQFTPDLMPSDVTGTMVFDLAATTFHLRQGPVFTNLLLADEVNRTPPKTQSALLEAMEEHAVSIDGTTYPLPSPFFVMATQNPIEHEGTYPLPEAQLDRFLMKIELDYPTEEAERAVIRLHDRGLNPHDLAAAGVRQVCGPAELQAARAEFARLTLKDEVLEYILQIARRTRELPQLLVGASPRAAVALMSCAKITAAMRGRDFVTPDDVKEVAYPVLRHRLILQPEAELEHLTPERALDAVLAAVPVPR